MDVQVRRRARVASDFSRNGDVRNGHTVNQSRGNGVSRLECDRLSEESAEVIGNATVRMRITTCIMREPEEKPRPASGRLAIVRQKQPDNVARTH